MCCTKPFTVRIQTACAKGMKLMHCPRSPGQPENPKWMVALLMCPLTNTTNLQRACLQTTCINNFWYTVILNITINAGNSVSHVPSPTLTLTHGYARGCCCLAVIPRVPLTRLFFETVSLTILCLFLPYQIWISTQHHAWLLVLENETQVLMFARPALYQVSHLSRPSNSWQKASVVYY